MTVSSVGSIDQVIGGSTIQQREPVERTYTTKEPYNILAAFYIRSGKSIIPMRIEDMANQLFAMKQMYTLPTQRRINVFGPLSDVHGGYHWLVKKDNWLFQISFRLNYPPFYPFYLGNMIDRLI